MADPINTDVVNLSKNEQFIKMFRDIIERSKKEGKKWFYQDYKAANMIYESSLQTLITLLEVTK